MATQTATSAGSELEQEARDFVAEAERITNAYDGDGAADAYADDAVFEAITDGAREVYRGQDEIRTAWRVMAEALKASGFTLRKELLTASDDLIVNTWEGSLGGRHEARGIEWWWRNPDGKVREHRMWSHMDLRSPMNPLQMLRSLISSPRLAFEFLRGQRSARR